LTEQRKSFELFIADELRKMSEKLDEIIRMDEKILGEIRGNRKFIRESIKLEGALDVMTLLSLPDNLRKTAMIMCKLTEATANDVAKESGRRRAVESDLLNQLTRMGYLDKKRKGRKAYFTLR